MSNTSAEVSAYMRAIGSRGGKSVHKKYGKKYSAKLSAKGVRARKKAIVLHRAKVAI